MRRRKLFDDALDEIRGGSITSTAFMGAVAVSLVANVIYDVSKIASTAIVNKIADKHKKKKKITTSDTGAKALGNIWPFRALALGPRLKQPPRSSISSCGSNLRLAFPQKIAPLGRVGRVYDELRSVVRVPRPT